ncbi:chymotrypsin-1-like [Lycorma delicatula]|uniref:chymotrypsin-1-like n=1 Tax=Lycorma delicatula TaxID=130591 RepID=UPI003F50FC58
MVRLYSLSVITNLFFLSYGTVANSTEIKESLKQNQSVQKYSSNINIPYKKEATLGQFPYEVSLQRILTSLPYSYTSLMHFCGGTLLSENKVLTAAYCFHAHRKNRPKDHYNYYAVAGINYLGDKNGVVRPVTEIHLHFNNKYKYANEAYYDIAIVDVEVFEFTVVVRPVVLSDTPAEISRTCFLIGWGAHCRKTGNYSKELMIVEETVENDDKCGRRVAGFLYPETLFCASPKKHYDSCYGDYGGPFICDGVQYGLAVCKTDECGLEIPTYYIDIFFFSNWIGRIATDKADKVKPIILFNIILTKAAIAVI